MPPMQGRRTSPYCQSGRLSCWGKNSGIRPNKPISLPPVAHTYIHQQNNAPCRLQPAGQTTRHTNTNTYSHVHACISFEVSGSPPKPNSQQRHTVPNVVGMQTLGIHLSIHVGWIFEVPRSPVVVCKPQGTCCAVPGGAGLNHERTCHAETAISRWCPRARKLKRSALVEGLTNGRARLISARLLPPPPPLGCTDAGSAPRQHACVA